MTKGIHEILRDLREAEDTNTITLRYSGDAGTKFRKLLDWVAKAAAAGTGSKG